MRRLRLLKSMGVLLGLIVVGILAYCSSNLYLRWALCGIGVWIAYLHWMDER